jgi:hypothetical protein
MWKEQQLCHAVAFVPDDVYVVATGIDKRHAFGIHEGLALGIGPFILRYGSRCDDDQAMPGVCVPAGASSRLPEVALEVQV